jgi:hypothetical protein
MARSLSAALTELYRWGEKHAPLFGVVTTDPLKLFNSGLKPNRR